MLPQEVPNERMKMNKIGFILAVVAVIGGIWFFCDRRDTPASDRPIVKIGLIYPLSGDSAVYGKAAQKAVDMLMEDLRKNNDLKYDYRFVWEDNQLKLATSATAANRLVLMEKTDALVTLFSNAALVVKQTADKHAVPHLSISTDPRTADGRYNFSIGTSPERQTRMFLDELSKRRIGRLDAVLLHLSGVQTTFDTFAKKARESGQVVIGNIHRINPGERDFTIMLLKIIRSAPDAIMIQAIMPEADILMRRLKILNSTIPVTGIETFSYLRDKTLAEGMWYVDAAVPDDDFVRRYQNKTGDEDTHYAAFTYAALQILISAYEQSPTAGGKPAAEDVIETLKNRTDGMPSVLGTLSLDAHGMIDTPPALREISGGKIITIRR